MFVLLVLFEQHVSSCTLYLHVCFSSLPCMMQSSEYRTDQEDQSRPWKKQLPKFEKLSTVCRGGVDLKPRLIGYSCIIHQLFIWQASKPGAGQEQSRSNPETVQEQARSKPGAVQEQSRSKPGASQKQVAWPNG